MKRFSSGLSRQEWLLLLLIFLVSFVSSGKWSISIAAWIAPLLVLRFLRNSQRWVAFWPLFLAIWIPNLFAWYDIMPLPIPIHVVFIGVQSALALIPYLLDRFLVRTFRTPAHNPFLLTLIFPLALTGFEFVNMGGSPLGSFGATAYSQYNLTFVMQLVAVTGIWGITFLMSWVASTVNWAWEQEFAWAKVQYGIGLVALVLIAVIGYGVARGMGADAAPATVRIASFTLENIDPGRLSALQREDEAAFRAETQGIHRAYLEHTAAVAQEGAQLVLWPEAAGIGMADDVTNLLTQGQTLARETGIYLAVPTFAFFADSDQPAENRLQVIEPSGAIVLNHVKYGGNMLEGTLAGDGQLTVVDTPFGKLSGVVCWDADFPTVVKQAGLAGADILLVPARLWRGVSAMHAEISAFRAVENGVTVIHQADSGVSQITGPVGNVLARVDPFTGGENQLLVDVPIQVRQTLYPRIGDVVGQVSALLTGILLLIGIVAAWRKRREAKQHSDAS